MPRPRTVDNRAVLEAAGRAMATHGPRELTLAVVAAEAGLSAATLVQRFGSRHGLLVAVSRHAATTAHERFDRARAAVIAGGDAARAVADAYAETVASVARDEIGHHIAHLGVDVVDPDLRAAAAEQARVLRVETADLLRSARLRPGTDVERLARAVYVTFNGSLVAWALDGTHPEAADTVRADVLVTLAPHLEEDP